MTRKYFGTDGIRGKVGVLPITPDFVMRLGYAAGKVLVQHRGNAEQHEGKHPTVLIGKDTRISGYMLEASLQAGFAAAGVDVLLAGPMPTPAIAYLTRALRLSAGVVISASHNPFDDNGIKFFSAQGNKLPDAVELDIEAQLDQPMQCVTSEKLGKARRLDDAQGRYIEFCKSSFPNELDLRGMKIVVDCAHGAAYHIAPHVLHELGADVIAIGNHPNGFNINAEVGATAPAALAKAVVEHHADLGIALDGDADRLIMTDATGRIYNGDELLYLLVQDRLAQNPVPGAGLGLVAGSGAGSGTVSGVVGTLMTNMALEVVFEQLGIPFARANVGDRYVLEMMRERGWLLGGEGSGHLLCLDKHSTGDGIISALQVLSACRRQGKTLPEFFTDITMFPQVLVNVRVAKGVVWQENAAMVAEKARIETELGRNGRVLIRASGTEPLIRVMVEARDQAVAQSMAQRLAAHLA